MATTIDQKLLERGTRAQQFLTAPTLFDQTLPGLFSGGANIRFDETQGGRFKKHFFGGLFGPTKKERAANKREIVAEKAALNQRTKDIAGRLRVAGRGDVLQFPAARDAVQAAAQGDPDARAAVESFFGPTEGQREAGIRRQQVTDATAEQTLIDQRVAASGGPFGSFLDRGQFTELEGKIGRQMAGASSLNNISETIRNLTDVEMAAIGSGAGGKIQGEIKAELFGLLGAMQTLLEQKPSVLRQADQELIAAALGNPDELASLLFSRESKTLATLDRFAQLLQDDAARSLSSMDDRTLALLAGVNKFTPSKFTRPEGPAVETDGPSDFTAPGIQGPAAGAGPTGGVGRLLKQGFDAFAEFERGRREANQ